MNDACRLSRRPLPPSDPAIDSLDPADRRALAQVWAGRAEGEARTAATFRWIHSLLLADGAAPALCALAERAVQDERRHAELCAAVASVYAGHVVPPPAVPSQPTLPVYSQAPESLLPALHVVGQCCLNETTAVAFLKTCLAHARSPFVRPVLRALLADEIDHARLGWSYLAAPAAEATRKAIAPWLLPMLQTNLRVWRDRPKLPLRPALAEHGCPPAEAIDQVVVAATRELVVPGLAHVGVDTREAAAWAAGLDAGEQTTASG